MERGQVGIQHFRKHKEEIKCSSLGKHVLIHKSESKLIINFAQKDL